MKRFRIERPHLAHGRYLEGDVGFLFQLRWPRRNNASHNAFWLRFNLGQLLFDWRIQYIAPDDVEEVEHG